jgi:hypothetical protein
MRFAGVVSVIPSVARVTAGSVSVMGGFLVLPAFMMLGCFVMMTSGLAVMFGCLAMMFGSFFRHRRISRLSSVGLRNYLPGSLGWGKCQRRIWFLTQCTVFQRE